MFLTYRTQKTCRKEENGLCSSIRRCHVLHETWPRRAERSASHGRENGQNESNSTKKHTDIISPTSNSIESGVRKCPGWCRSGWGIRQKPAGTQYFLGNTAICWYGCSAQRVATLQIHGDPKMFPNRPIPHFGRRVQQSQLARLGRFIATVPPRFTSSVRRWILRAQDYFVSW